MKVVAIKNLFTNLHTKKTVETWARVYKNNTYTIHQVAEQDGMLMYQLEEISANCWYPAKNFVPLSKHLENVEKQKALLEQVSDAALERVHTDLQPCLQP